MIADLQVPQPLAEFKGRDDEYAIFYALERIGAITLLAGGPERLKCFEPRGPDGMILLEKLNSATRTDDMAAATRKRGADVRVRSLIA